MHTDVVDNLIVPALYPDSGEMFMLAKRGLFLPGQICNLSEDFEGEIATDTMMIEKPYYAG